MKLNDVFKEIVLDMAYDVWKGRERNYYHHDAPTLGERRLRAEVQALYLRTTRNSLWRWECLVELARHSGLTFPHAEAYVTMFASLRGPWHTDQDILTAADFAHSLLERGLITKEQPGETMGRLCTYYYLLQLLQEDMA